MPAESESAQDADMITMGNIRNDHWCLELNDHTIAFDHLAVLDGERWTRMTSELSIMSKLQSNMCLWICLLCHVFGSSASEIVSAKLTSRWGGSFSPQRIEFLMRKTLQCKESLKDAGMVEDLKNTSRFQDVSYCGSNSLQQPRVSHMAYWSKLATHQECTITVHKGKNCNRTNNEETRGIAARGCQTQEVP